MKQSRTAWLEMFIPLAGDEQSAQWSRCWNKIPASSRNSSPETRWANWDLGSTFQLISMLISSWQITLLRKKEYTLSYFFPKQRRQLMESWRTERITYGRGKKNKTGGGNVINECKGSLTRKFTWCQTTYWTTMNVNKNQSHSSKCKYNRDAHQCSPAVVL